jgi:hypothetical protein
LNRQDAKYAELQKSGDEEFMQNRYAVEAQQINVIYDAKGTTLPDEVAESLRNSVQPVSAVPGWIERLRSVRLMLWNRKVSTMKWITRERVKVDRVACPWLIKKFVDPQAEFLFVPADQVMAVAKQEGATPYDVKDVELGHHGKECSFEAILKKYDLTNDPALVLLGKIVNGADTDNTLWCQPEGAGLNAIAEGFRHLGYKDDHELNTAEWIIYDALYAYCQASVRQGKPEGAFKN